MLGIDYASSDEEEVVPATKPELTNFPSVVTLPPEPLSKPAPLEQPRIPLGPVNGPSQVPTVTPPPTEEQSTDGALPGSPYASNRALVQNLTLPTVPNFDIPPSPPGSPSQRATKKFAQFLDLKKKGQHFNQRLEGSSVLRDPGHLQRLLEFARISEEDSYTSTLSEDVAVPAVFPEWAYVEELRASQKRIAKAKEVERLKAPRETIDFVSSTRSGTSSRTGSPSGKASRPSAPEKGMADLDKEQTRRSSSQNLSKRKGLEHRGRENPSSGGGPRSGSRSPKRRRSRSTDRRR
ncbi:uncharacterized protein K460DRAFT_377009 [Cucurbitaria berberidis CBS 394.84]|uniref:HCNGP-domain-containing protein n=1 Tax=Cucurbitaria berberidis CBS 394.84 TaxID=1168544 RepID=A0A9P4GGG6_9PLEO|nr:uncharacterized protein K460DRAFT_377009 [Cucurbitaria berberidis CBS 394.84]KAF1845638.1 hypothetical protein K460DRAFT_377009 [Cucurbitaria berberidis CBS 394.84]